MDAFRGAVVLSTTDRKARVCSSLDQRGLANVGDGHGTKTPFLSDCAKWCGNQSFSNDSQYFTEHVL